MRVTKRPRGREREGERERERERERSRRSRRITSSSSFASRELRPSADEDTLEEEGVVVVVVGLDTWIVIHEKNNGGGV